MTDPTTITMGEYIDNLTQETSISDATKLISKKGTDDPKYTEKSEFSGGMFIERLKATGTLYPSATDTPSTLSSRIVTNVEKWHQLYGTPTVQTGLYAFNIPKALSGTITFLVKAMAATADGNEVQVRISYAVVDDGDDLDSATFTDIDSGDHVTSSTQNEQETITLTETASNLGWDTDGVRTYIKVERIAIDGGTELASDLEIEETTIYGDYA